MPSSTPPASAPPRPAAVDATSSRPAAPAAAAPAAETQQQPPLPLTGMERLALHSQPMTQAGTLTFVPASALRAASRSVPPPPPTPAAPAAASTTTPASQGAAAPVAAVPTAAEQAARPFYAIVRGHRLGDACGPYLISALMQLPTARRQEVLSSLQAWAAHAATAREAPAIRGRLEHVLRTYLRITLPATYAPFHPQDPAWAPFRALPFEARALVEHYLGAEPQLLASPHVVGLLKGLHRCRGLAEAEALVAQYAGRKDGGEGLADVLLAASASAATAAEGASLGGGGCAAVNWAMQVALDKGAGCGFRVKSLGPAPLRGASTFMHRAVGGDRFLRVRLVNRRQWCSPVGAHALDVLAQQGIPFACRRYRYVAHKGKGDAVCYFLAEESTGREAPGFKPLSAHEAVARLGNFLNFPSVPRLVARVGLAFSRSFPLVLEPRQIELIDDVKADGGEVMTDGSGFIAADLAALLPPHLFQGRAAAATAAGATSGPPEGPSVPLPPPFAVVQVRCLCHLGGFKGTLLVHPQLRGKVRLRRESMLKFPPPSPSVGPLAKGRPVTLDVLTSFRVLKATTRLSRELVLILLHLGVPQRVFLRLCDDELRELEASRHDPSQALALLQRSSAALIRGSSEWQAAAMLRAGHAPTEPHIARALGSLRARALGKLQQGRLLCPGSLYVVGQPDPLGVLESDEVFVCHGLPKGHHGLPRTDENEEKEGEEDGVYAGHVLLARHPIHDPAHMRAFKAVRAPALSAFLQGRAGVLFFSTKGARSPASLLSNGDLDGDVFFVCMHPEIVASASAASGAAAAATATAPDAAPCPGSERITHVGPFRFNEEPAGYRIDAALMRRCLESCIAQAKAVDIVAACSDWWVKHADARGAGSTNCRILGTIAARALDSAKTGRLWSLPAVLKPAHQPFYLQKGGGKGATFNPADPQHREQARRFAATGSSSLLGQLHMRALPALEAEAALHAAQAPRLRELDPDLRAEGAPAFLQQAQGWLQSYRRTFSRRMSRRALTGNDDPGEFQAIRNEVVTPFKRLLLQQATAAAAAAAPEGKGQGQQGPAAGVGRAKQEGEKKEEKEKEEGPGDKAGTAADAGGAQPRRPLQTITNTTTTNNVRPPPPPVGGEPKKSGGSDGDRVRLALASAVYEASYLSGCLAFPWDLALPELNALKAEAAERRRRAGGASQPQPQQEGEQQQQQQQQQQRRRRGETETVERLCK